MRTAGVEESIVIKETDVIAILRKLKSNKTNGPDGLKAHPLKDCALQLKGVFTRPFQSIKFQFLKSAVPELWKYSVIQPVYKKLKQKISLVQVCQMITRLLQ